MAYRLSLWYKGEELCSREDPADDPVVAIQNCRQFEAEVVPVIRQLPQFKRIQVGELEKHTTLIELQLALAFPATNGRHK